MALLSLPGLGRSRSQERQEQSAVSKEQGNGLTNRVSAKMSFWKRRTANITDYDPTYRVIYLGNVLTGWAKGAVQEEVQEMVQEKVQEEVQEEVKNKVHNEVKGKV